MRALLAGAIFAVVIGAVAPAAADPCTARLPTREGTQFSGVVQYIVDGDGLCVGPAGGDGSTWIEVRLMDYNAPERGEAGAREAADLLRSIAFGQQADCVVTRGRTGTRSYDRTHAVCVVNGRRLGDAMRAGGAAEGGNDGTRSH